MRLTSFVLLLTVALGFLTSCEDLKEISSASYFNAPAKKRNIRLDKRFRGELAFENDQDSKIFVYSNRHKNIITTIEDGEEIILFSGKVSRYKNMYFLSQPLEGDSTWLIFGLVVNKNQVYGLNHLTQQPAWIDSAITHGGVKEMICGYDSTHAQYILHPNSKSLYTLFYPRVMSDKPVKTK